MTRVSTRLSRLTAAMTIAGALIAGAAAPAHAAKAVDDDHVVTVDAGNGITATVVRGCGSLTVQTPTPFVWDPWLRAMFPNRADRSGLGDGWRVDTMFIKVDGGVQYYFPEFGSMFAPDPTLPTGLLGYPGDDIRAEYEDGVVPARDGVPDREYHFTLHHLDTGEMKYFSWNGDLLASIHPNGSRTDWVFHEVVPHRLVMFADDGGITRLNWDSEADTVVIEEPDGGWIRLILEAGVLHELVTERARSVFGVNEWDHATWQYNWIGTNATTDPEPQAPTHVSFWWFEPNRVGEVERVFRNGELVYVPRGTGRRPASEVHPA